MESYMEVTWLTGFLILLNAGTLAFYLSAKPCRYRYVILYSAVIPLLACTLFHRLEWLFTVFIEALFSLDLSRSMEKLAVDDGPSLIMQLQLLCVVRRKLSSRHIFY